MHSADNQTICNLHVPGIIWARDIFGEYVEPASGFLPTKGQHISIPPGESIFSAGAAPTAIIVITSGQALLVYNSGTSVTIHAESHAEPVFGMLESLSNTKFDIELTAVTECGVSIYGADEVFGHIRRSPALSFRLAQAVADLYMKTVRRGREH